AAWVSVAVTGQVRVPAGWYVSVGVQPVGCGSPGAPLVQTTRLQGTWWNGSLGSKVLASNLSWVSVVRVWLRNGFMIGRVGGVLSRVNVTSSATETAPCGSWAIARTFCTPGAG